MDNFTVEDVLMWIVNHNEDEVAMTKIAITAYPFSSKFKNRYPEVVNPTVHTPGDRD